MNTGYAILGWLGPKACEIKTSIELDIISIILGDSTSSRMYQNLVEKRDDALFNMISSEHYQFKDGDNFFIQANFKPESKELALNLIKKELANIRETRITDEELAKAKKKIKTRFAYSAETVSEIGETIGYYMTVCEDLQLVEQYLADLDSITVDDLNNTIDKYLNINNSVISVLIPEE